MTTPAQALIAPRTPRFSRRVVAGVSMLVIGAILLATAGAYYGYVFFATRDLDRLVVDPTESASETLAGVAPSAPSAAGRPAPAWQQLYPGSSMPARQWADPRGTLQFASELLTGFTPVTDLGRPSIAGAIGRAERISIPALAIDVQIEELAIQDLGDSASYVTPKLTVGHIPGSPNPGSHGNGWYFGHLESPLQGEGNVFARLPRVPELLRRGEEVHVILRSGDRDYLYEVSETDLIHHTQMSLYQAGNARVTLVTCFPRLLYDQRLLVTANLIGFRDAADA